MNICLDARLASLLRNDTIVIGTVIAVAQRAHDERHRSGRRVNAPTDVDLVIEEWLWVNQPKRNYQPQQIRFLLPERPNIFVRQERRDKPLQVGDTLLCAISNSAERSQGSVRPFRSPWILTDTDLFTYIVDVIRLHSRYLDHPEEIAGAVQLLTGRIEFLLGGCLVSYFWRQSRDVDNEALTLSKLIGKRQLPEPGRIFVRMALSRRLMSTLNPTSEQVRRVVTENLVSDASGNDINVAAEATLTLMRLITRGDFDLRPYLDRARSRKINENYWTLLRLGKLEKRDSRFESQLQPAN